MWTTNRRHRVADTDSEPYAHLGGCCQGRIASSLAPRDGVQDEGHLSRPMSSSSEAVQDSADTLVLTLPDGSTREVPYGTLPRDVVASIGARLARDAIAVAVDGAGQDLATPIRTGGAFVVLTEKDPRSLDVLRHSAAHVLATAVRRVRPYAKIGFGPAIEDGFYYDFEVAAPFTPEDVAQFEEEMRRVSAEKFPFVREEVSRNEAQR